METKIEKKDLEEKKENVKNTNNHKTKPKPVKKLNFEEEFFLNTKPKITIKGAFRYIENYPKVYKSYVKQRWEKRGILEVFSKEFRAENEEYYKQAILNGKIKVNGKTVTEDYKLKPNELIEHETIKTEPPVYSLPIEKIYEDDELLVINKPPSIPVHICGNYAFNTIGGILRTDWKYTNIYCNILIRKKLYPTKVLHRLDKLTSGLLLISKKAELATSFHQELKEKKVGKIYLARVHGKFLTDSNENQELVVEKPIFCVSKRDAKYDVCQASEKTEKNAKDACTKFKSLWYDAKSDTTLVECKLITGKTHQVRVHLKSTGHSIVNDTNYGGKFVGNLLVKYMEEKNPEEKNYKKIKLNDYNEKKVYLNEKEEEKKENVLNSNKKQEIDSHVMEIWLHSFQYQFQEKEFVTKMPYWAVHKNIEF